MYNFLATAGAKYGVGFWKPGSGIIHQVNHQINHRSKDGYLKHSCLNFYNFGDINARKSFQDDWWAQKSTILISGNSFHMYRKFYHMN